MYTNLYFRTPLLVELPWFPSQLTKHLCISDRYVPAYCYAFLLQLYLFTLLFIKSQLTKHLCISDKQAI